MASLTHSLISDSLTHSLTLWGLDEAPSLKLFNFIFFWQFNYSGFEKENLNLQSPRHERIKQETKRPMDPCTSRTKQLGLLKGPYR